MSDSAVLVTGAAGFIGFHVAERLLRDGRTVIGLDVVNDYYDRADAFLFGRRTYELFADYWGAMKNPDSPITDALNRKPKYVASNSLTEGRWADTTVLSGDLAVAIGELKATQANLKA